MGNNRKVYFIFTSLLAALSIVQSPKGRLSILRAQEKKTQSVDMAQSLELQLNSRFWQLLSREELEPLSELRREGNSVRRVVSLEFLYPGLQTVDSVDSRNRQGELLEVELQSLEDSYLELARDGALVLVLAGKLQRDPEQLNVYGDPWPEATLRLWLEDDFEPPFLLAELENYQRFSAVQIEVQVFKNLRQTVSQVLHRSKDPRKVLPDMILADGQTIVDLRHLFADLTTKERREEASLACLDLFFSNNQFYASPLALARYSLMYNPELLGADSLHANGSQVKLSELFGRLDFLSQGREPGAYNPYFLAFGDDSMPFVLLLYSFLKSGDISDSAPDIAGLRAGLRYLRKQGREGLLRQLDFAEERFAKGDIAVVIGLSSHLQHIVKLTNSRLKGKSRIQAAELPYNDLQDNDTPSYARVWSLAVVRSSLQKPHAMGLRRYLLRGAVQSQFDLASGILPSNTLYYPFYQRSDYYQLLPEAELRDIMNPRELGEFGAKRRRMYRDIEGLQRLFHDRIQLLLDSEVSLSQLLGDLRRQWQNEVLPRQEFVFLR